MKRAWAMVALMLLAIWPVMTSHALLQRFGVIHEVHHDHDGGAGSHEHGSDPHDFADGGYLRGLTTILLHKIIGLAAMLIVAFAVLLPFHAPAPRDGHSGLAPPGTAPPEISHRWQFAFRAALPVRAPSFAS